MGLRFAKRYAMTFLSLILVGLSLAAQAAPAPKVVPVSEEPRHHVRFENKYVRVIEAIFPAGDTTLFHTHSRDNVPIAIEPALLRTTVLGSSTFSDSTVERGRTTWAAATYTHQIRNLGSGRVHFIDAEVIASPGIRSEPTLNGLPGHTLIFENEKVRAYRVILQPGQSTGGHKHGLSFLNVSVSGGELAVESGGKKSSKQKVSPGAFSWSDGPLTHSVKNLGSAGYEMVDVEWK
jgi:quercetin dioxygenase-like cupin family protein